MFNSNVQMINCDTISFLLLLFVGSDYIRVTLVKVLLKL